MKTGFIALVLLLMTVLGGCVSMPKPLAGDYSVIRPADVGNTPSLTGRSVRWGGSILKTYNDDGRSCMEILGQTLDDDIARPQGRDLSTGRFVACKSSFLDPEIFAPGRDVTITGRIERIEATTINDFDYQYAVVATDVLFLWPEDSSGYYAGNSYQAGDGYYVARYRQPSYYPYAYGGFYSPFYYPWYFGGFGHGFYGPGFYSGFYGGFYNHPGFYGGFRGGYGYRNIGPRNSNRQYRDSYHSSRGGFRSSPGAVRSGGSGGRSGAASATAGSATRRQ
jgi:outer membrane lipoprotein